MYASYLEVDASGESLRQHWNSESAGHNEPPARNNISN